MFKWPGEPSARAPEHELADFAELVAWQCNSMSMTALSRFLGRLDENDYSDGVPEEEETDQLAEDAYREIEQRKEGCGDGYPFEITKEGYTLCTPQKMESHKHTIYRYLLLATRLNMKDNRRHAGIDGALLFEELAADVAREYLGARAESLVFGTAAESTDFQGKVEDLCRRIKEGDGFVNRDKAPPNERDGKLDVVVWKHFTDGLPGKLIAFGQCKTGTSYKDELTQLQPDKFCSKWLRWTPVLPPVRMFFVSEALLRSRWHSTSTDAGLLFDRCRIVDFSNEVSADVVGKIKAWTEAAARATDLDGIQDR